MKRLLALLLITMLLYTSCAVPSKTAKARTTTSDEYDCLTVLDTSWGMSMEECMKALNVTQDDFIAQEQTSDSSVFQIEMKLFDKNVKVAFECIDKLCEKSVAIGLSLVRIEFVEEIETDYLVEKIKKEYAAKNIKPKLSSGTTLLDRDCYVESYSNSNTIGSLEESLRKKIHSVHYKDGCKGQRMR